MNIYTKINGQLSRWQTDSSDIEASIEAVKNEADGYSGPILAVIDGSKKSEPFLKFVRASELVPA